MGNWGKLNIENRVRIRPNSIILNGHTLETEGSGMAMLNAAYRRYVGNYPKFFKMDALCKAGFVASELLLQDAAKSGQLNLAERFVPREDVAVVMFSKTGSYCTDAHYQTTICDDSAYFPSPSVFVYTLPNIVTGEICIRNKFEGESSCYVLDCCNAKTIRDILQQTFSDSSTRTVLTGWIDCTTDDDFNVLMGVVTSPPPP